MSRRNTMPALFVTAAFAVGCAGNRTGILVMAHGGNDEWNRAVQTTVEPLRQRYPVEIAFGMARSDTLEEAVRRLEARGVSRIAVVRLFVDAASFLDRTEYILGLREDPPTSHPNRLAAHTSTGDADRPGGTHKGHPMPPAVPIHPRAKVFLSREGVSDSPLVEEILLDRVRALSRNPEQEAVLLLAHGVGDEEANRRWLENMRTRARRLFELGPFRAVACETLREDWPDKRRVARRRIRETVTDWRRQGLRVIVVPFRIAGFGPYREVLDGLEYVADGRAFCPHPNMTRWIEQAALRCLPAQNTPR